MQKMGTGFRKGDLSAILAVILLAGLLLALFLPKGNQIPARAEIYQDGRLIKTLELDRDQEFVLEAAYTTTIAVRDGKIGVIRSDCPGEDCVRSGWLGSTGRSIVCLPNGLEIRVVAETGDMDFVVG